MRLRVWLSSLVVALAAGCATSSAGVGTAVLTTAVAAGASAVSRSQGKCYAACPDGTTCNEATGLCEEIPCRGRCAPNEKCERRGAFDKCVPAAEVDLQIERTPAEPARVTPQ